MEIPAARAVLNNLTPKEFQHLSVAQSAYLRATLSPELSAERHRQMATEIGLHHFCTGLSEDVLAESSVLYTDITAALVAGSPDTERLMSVITRRFQHDLIVQIGAYALIQQRRLAAHEHIARQRHTAHPLDFAQDTLETLLDTLGVELTGVALGGVRNGNYRHLLAKGKVPFGAADPRLPEYSTIAAPEIQRAWFDEQSLIVNSSSQHTGMSAAWRRECMTLGIRSLGIFLMYDPQGAPSGCLLVCGRFPGYFMNEGTLHYWQQVADLVGANLDFIERSRERRRHRLADGLRLRQLLSQGKVEMYYQPIVDPSSGRTEKIEALARLKDVDETISPGLFLPAFGVNQLRDLFDVGIARVLGDLSEMSGTIPPCSINLPPEAMFDGEWLKTLPDQLTRLGADPHRISLEIVESALSDEREVLDALFALREAGYSIFLDDVGTGESSLLRLATLPVNGIKIDQCFVRSLQKSFEHLDLILSMRSLASQRGLECVAEGVEDADIVDTLGGLSGLLLQGYAFAKPMNAEALSDWMLRRSEGEPLPDFPRSLYGWYALHVDRFFTMRNALQSISDLVSVERLQDAEGCPLNAMLARIGGDHEIEAAHREWHANYTRFTTMVHDGADPLDLWRTMEACKQELRTMVEGKLRSDAAHRTSLSRTPPSS